MKLPCKVIEDMLPMYYDGICSEESKAVVEEHLKVCKACEEILAQLGAEMESPKAQIDDLKPLKRIQRSWRKSRKTAMAKGFCVALAVLVFVTTIVSCIWYFDYAKYYFRLTDQMTRVTGEESTMTYADYRKDFAGHQFDVALPVFLSNSGFVRVMNNKGIVLFFYPQRGGSYTHRFLITDEENRMWSVQLRSDIAPDFDRYPASDQVTGEKLRIQQLVSEKREDIVDMLDAVRELYNIQLLATQQ